MPQQSLFSFLSPGESYIRSGLQEKISSAYFCSAEFYIHNSLHNIWDNIVVKILKAATC